MNVSPQGFVVLDLEEKFLAELIESLVQNGVKPPLMERYRICVVYG